MQPVTAVFRQYRLFSPHPPVHLLKVTGAVIQITQRLTVRQFCAAEVTVIIIAVTVYPALFCSDNICPFRPYSNSRISCHGTSSPLTCAADQTVSGARRSVSAVLPY